MLWILLLMGCIKQYSVTMGDQPAEDAHYVIVQMRPSGMMRIYDCQSKPDGQNWEPTCVRAELRQDAPGAESPER